REGREVWRFAARGPIAQRPAISDGMVYVGGLDHCFYALTTDGTLRWVFRGSQGAISIGEPVLTDDAVVFGSRDGILYCLGRADGALRWKFVTQGIVTTRPVIHEGRIYFGSDDTNFYAITVGGELVWKFKVNGLLDSWPVLDKGVLYFGSYDCHAYALEAATGILRWKFATSMGTPSPVDFTPFKKKEPAVTVTWRSQDIGTTEKRYREQGSPVVTGGSAYATKSQYIERSQYAAGSKSRYAR
ncbi:MAG TPA: PQQ-binding-like beta-propeller repeat protein, partial [archaeon]|nr:PQQ-binding-like beta-propeller repeat protein [archaeon]